MVDERIVTAQRELDAERANGARKALEELGDPAALTDETRDHALLVRLRCDLALDEAADRIILTARGAATRTADPGLRAELLAEAAFGYAAKRCDALATAAAEEAERLVPTASRGPAIRGFVHMAFDRREEARKDYERAAHLDEPWRGVVGLARVDFVCGFFESAEAAVDHVGDAAPARLRALRIAADVARVRHDFARFLELQATIMALTEGGYRARSDALARASALFRLGRRDEALDAYRSTWREKEDDWPGYFSRTVLNNIERASGAAPGVALLAAFPTVSQKRNYCGPATLELVLRHLGVEATQDSIAATVKRGEGTSTLAMTKYLEGLGLCALRFEGNPTRLRACIDLGLPVIVEEEYSTTNHVAVVMGVDEERGVLLLQDPMTHVTQERLVETEGNLRRIFRNAALVAFKADDAVAERLRAAGVVDQPHIRRTDECSDDAVSADPDRILERCEQALRDCEDYPLAWLMRLRALFRKLLAAWNEPNRAIYLAALRAARVRYPLQEWPHQQHAHYLMATRRHEEALIEWEEALRLDRWDSNNAQYVAECHVELRRPDEAAAAFWKTLKIDATHVRATENFASLALERGEVDLAAHLSTCAREMSPGNPFNFATAARIADKAGRTDEVMPFLRDVVRLDPAIDFAASRVRLADLLRAKGDKASVEEALALCLALVKRHPGYVEPRLKAATFLQEGDDLDRACSLILEGEKSVQDAESASKLLDGVKLLLIELGRDHEAIALAARLADKFKSEALVAAHLDLLFDHDVEEGLDATERFAKEAPESHYRAVKYAKWLVATPRRSEAEAILKKALEAEPSLPWRRRKLIEILTGEDRVAEAIEVARAEPKPDAGLLVDQAMCENDLGRHSDAHATLARSRKLDQHASFVQQREWTIALLGGSDAETALQRLADEDSPDLFMKRARVSIAAALGRHDEALRAVSTLPEDDWLTRYLLGTLLESSDAYRDPYEARLRRQLETATWFATRRSLRASLAGSRAARGDRGGLDRAIAGERNVRRLGNVVDGLCPTRQPVLVAEVRGAIERLGVESDVAYGQRAHAQAARGAHREAADTFEALLRQWPRESWIAPCLAETLVAAGETERAAPALDHCRRQRLTSRGCTVMTALTALMSEDETTARSLLDRADRARIASGMPRGELSLLVASRAVLERDRAALEEARRLPAWHTTPESPIWAKLAERI